MAKTDAATCECNWDKCAKACDCRCHIAVEAASDHYYKLGQSSGMEIAGSRIMELAVEAFRRGSNKEAAMLRELSEKLTTEGKAMHPGPGIKYEEA